jgi:predicted lipid-binding transport protein (Tim44 family)
MNETLLDIIALVAITIFLALRLRSILGTVDHDNQQKKESAPIVRNQISKKIYNLLPSRYKKYEDCFVEDNLTGIKKYDKSFNKEKFLEKARNAYEAILIAFYQGNKEFLKPLLEKEVFAQFEVAIDEQHQREEINDSKIVKIIESEITGIILSKGIATITVKFVSGQNIIIRNKNGYLIEGHPDVIVIMKDEWEFTRNLELTSNNWYLSATRSFEDE